MRMELVKLIRARLSYFFATAYMKERFYVKLKCPHCNSLRESFQLGQLNTCLRCNDCHKEFWAGAIYMCNGSKEKLKNDLAMSSYKTNEVISRLRK